MDEFDADMEGRFNLDEFKAFIKKSFVHE